MSVELLEELTEELLPRVLPPGWRVAPAPSAANKFYTHDGMSIISSAELIDGKRWLHVSCARPARLPSWDDLKNVKAVFIGKDKTAISVLPSEDKYVNHHPFALHLWHCLDGEVVPDMRRFGVL